MRIKRRKWWHRRKLGTAEPAFYDHRIFEYEDMARYALAEPVSAYARIPCVCPGWDNSPRRKEAANIFINSTPEKYERWLREVVNRRMVGMSASVGASISPQSLIFINAWNEWAEEQSPGTLSAMGPSIPGRDKASPERSEPRERAPRR